MSCGSLSLEHFYRGPDLSPASQKRDSIFQPNLNIYTQNFQRLSAPSFLKCHTLCSCLSGCKQAIRPAAATAWLGSWHACLCWPCWSLTTPSPALPSPFAGWRHRAKSNTLLPPPTMAIAVPLCRAGVGISACLWALLLLAVTCWAKSWLRSSHLKPCVGNFFHTGP